MQHLDNAKRRTTRIVAAAAALLASGAIMSAPAWGYNTLSPWSTSSVPLAVSGYGSNAKGYGKIKIYTGSNGTRLYSYSWHKFTDADNHKSYVKGKTQFNAGSCQNVSITVTFKGVEVAGSTNCAATYYNKDDFNQSGLNSTKSAWTEITPVSLPVESGADRGRLEARMAIDVPWRTDPVSGPAQSAADSW